MAQYVLNIKGSVVPWRTLCRLRPDEISVSNVTEEQKHYIFDKAIHDMVTRTHLLRGVQTMNSWLTLRMC